VRSVFVGYACNNACCFCAQGDRRLYLDDARDLIAEARAAGADGGAIAVVGGEPTLHPALFDIVRAAREAGATGVIVQTNGRRLAYAAFARGLVEAGATGVDVSLHGSSAGMHEYHTRVAGSFAQTVSGIGQAAAVGLRVGVTVVVTRSNYRHLAELARLVRGSGAHALHLTAVQPFGGALANRRRLLPPPALVSPWLAESLRVARALGLEVAMGDSIPATVRDSFPGLGPTTDASVVPPLPAAGPRAA
jgi:MoaA/NifB/PqqE/SkfB family radical SAM enzyme